MHLTLSLSHPFLDFIAIIYMFFFFHIVLVFSRLISFLLTVVLDFPPLPGDR